MRTKTTEPNKPRAAPRARPLLSVQIASRAAGIPSARKLRHWTKAALRTRASITVRIVGKREGRTLNHRYRGRDYATNVLTFTYPDHAMLAGDIALCAPVIGREARNQGKTLEAHYAHLLVHGLLHLQGHDHQATREAQCMEAREIAILKRLGYPDPYRVSAN
jgi:probable rRNA maturation factor